MSSLSESGKAPGENSNEPGRAGMVQILVLLLGSATVGVMIAPRHNVYMILAASPIVAMVAATEARLSGFGVLATVAITFGCVTISQIAYLLIMWLSMTDAGANR